MESHCLFRVGFSSLIKSISKIRQSSLFWHFPKIRGHMVLILQVVSDCSSLVLFNSLVKVSAREADITCITQVTQKMINNALLIHKGWLVFPHFDFVLDLSTCVHRADSCIDLPTEVCELSAYCICRFLVLKRQHDSDWGFIVVRNLLLCL